MYIKGLHLDVLNKMLEQYQEPIGVTVSVNNIEKWNKIVESKIIFCNSFKISEQNWIISCRLGKELIKELNQQSFVKSINLADSVYLTSTQNNADPKLNQITTNETCQISENGMLYFLLMKESKMEIHNEEGWIFREKDIEVEGDGNVYRMDTEINQRQKNYLFQQLKNQSGERYLEMKPDTSKIVIKYSRMIPNSRKNN